MPLPPSPSGVNWTVLTNQVDIATNPPAYDGTNFLSLMSGAISNTLPTVAGRKYVLQYAQGSLPVTGFFVANLSDPVSEFDAKGNGSVFAGIPNGVTNPAAVAFDAGGNLYVADDFANTVEKFTPPNTAGTLFLSATNGLIVPDALAVDSSGNIYVANFGPTGFGDGNVQEFTPGGVLMNIIEATNGPAALAFDGSGNLYVADYFGGSDGNGSIEVFPPPYTIGTTYLTITNGLFNPDALAFDGKGNLYVANASGNNVEEFAPQITNIVANLGQSFLIYFSFMEFDGN
jgi:secreted PhoX family phosphatase